MRRLLFIRPFLYAFWLLAVMEFLTSCSKSSNNNTACITELKPTVSDYQVSGPELDSIYLAFRLNNLDPGNLRFDSWITFGIPGDSEYSGLREVAIATQFINAIPVFDDDIYFTFYSYKYVKMPAVNYYGISPAHHIGYTGPLPNADITTHQSLQSLRNSFISQISKIGNTNSGPFYTASYYTDHCLQATLGYLDSAMVNSDTVAANYNQELIKVWKIVPSDFKYTVMNKQAPTVYVKDDDGKAWSPPPLRIP